MNKNYLQTQQLFETSGNPDINDIIHILSKIRTSIVTEETDLQKVIASCLTTANVGFKKEYQLGPRNKIDFYIAEGIGIEVKKGKPNRAVLLSQVSRYASFPQIQSLLVVTEKNIYLPAEVNGKPCMVLALNKLWGLAI